MSKKLNVAVIGATGNVGREVLSILAERNFPLASIRAFASASSLGETVYFGEQELKVEELSEHSFDGVDLAFFGINSELTKKYCALATSKGVICIDKSSAHREDLSIPLIVPEVNREEIARYKERNIISVPNCVAIPLVQVLAPLSKKARIKRVVMSSYQAVSGAGKGGVDELQGQVRDLFNMREPSTSFFGNRIAFNVLPCIPARNAFLPDGSTEEETKVIFETKRILGDQSMGMAATCVRVPVFNGHSEAVNIEFESAMSPEEARAILAEAATVKVMDDPQAGIFPTPLDATGDDVTLVGRVRRDFSVPYGLSLWLSCDNLRTGAALNAVRIAEILVSEYLA